MSGALSLMLRLAGREPVEVGRNPIVIVQLEPTASVTGLSGQSLDWL